MREHAQALRGSVATERITIIYNKPVPGKLHHIGESSAVAGVLQAVADVKTALLKHGYDVETVPLHPPLALAKRRLARLKAGMVFNLFEGFDDAPGSEACIARALEEMEVPFTGSPSRALALSENKAEAKQVLRERGIPTPNWQVLSPQTRCILRLRLPCIVKPQGQHASHGISADSVVHDIDSMAERVEFNFNSYAVPSLVEEFIPGREFCALAVGNERPGLFPIEEIVYDLPPGRPQILTYAAKWTPGDEYFTGTRAMCPAVISHQAARRIEDLALKSFAAIGCRGYARIDMRQAQNGDIMVLEVNPNPDISRHGGARLQAEAAGHDHADFINKIVSLARTAFPPTGQPRCIAC